MPLLNEGHWLYGSIFTFSKDPLLFLNKHVPDFDGIFRVKSPALIQQLAVISKPEYVKYVLQDNNKNYEKSFGYKIMKLLLGNGLLTSEGDFWRRQRRLAQPAFHRNRLSNFVNIMTDATQHLIDQWDKNEDGQEINLSNAMMGITIEIVSKAMFSTDVAGIIETVNKEFSIANEALIKRIVSPIKIPLWMPLPSIQQEKKSYQSIRNMVKNIIEKRRIQNHDYDDLLAMLMEAKDEESGEMMSDKQILDEVVTIFLAGHETTAVALTWLFHCLDENPEVLLKLKAEAENVLNGRIPVLEDLSKLEYTMMVIEETLRLFPPAWIIGRKALHDDVIDGYFIPKGINVLMPVYQIHRHPNLWSEPEIFKPERFEKSIKKNYHKYQYFPFGGGPRLCIGNNFALMEMQIVVPMLIQKFQLKKPENFHFKKDPLITMRPEPEMRMNLYSL